MEKGARWSGWRRSAWLNSYTVTGLRKAATAPESPGGDSARDTRDGILRRCRRYVYFGLQIKRGLLWQWFVAFFFVDTRLAKGFATANELCHSATHTAFAGNGSSPLICPHTIRLPSTGKRIGRPTIRLPSGILTSSSGACLRKCFCYIFSAMDPCMSLEV